MLERKKKEKITQTLYTLKHLWTGGKLIDTLNHVKNMLIKTPINQWPLQSYSVTLSQLILIKAEWSKPRKCYRHHPLLSIFFYFSGKKTKPKLLIDRRQGKQIHKMYMADSLYVRLLARNIIVHHCFFSSFLSIFVHYLSKRKKDRCRIMNDYD